MVNFGLNSASILGMVNFGLNSVSILGIVLAVAGAGLYFLRSIRPELSRDHDIFFAAVGLICGIILFWQGWRFDPILQVNQFLITGAVVFFAVETIRLRGVTTEQARRNTPIVDERPISREYRAELEQLEPYEYERERDDRYDNNPRLRGYDDPRRSSAYDVEEPRNTRSRRPSASSDPYSNKETTRKRRRPPSSAANESYNESYDEWKESNSSREEPPTRPRRRPSDEVAPDSRTQKRRRPPIKDDEPFKGQYVDYQPIDDSNQNEDEWDQPSSAQPKSKPEREPQNNNPMQFDY